MSPPPVEGIVEGLDASAELKTKERSGKDGTAGTVWVEKEPGRGTPFYLFFFWFSVNPTTPHIQIR